MVEKGREDKGVPVRFSEAYAVWLADVGVCDVVGCPWVDDLDSVLVRGWPGSAGAIIKQRVVVVKVQEEAGLFLAGFAGGLS